MTGFPNESKSEKTSKRVIEKKTWPDYFQKIVDGVKTFEVRLADWECEPGDTLVLREYDPARKEYTGRSISLKVSYVSRSKDWKYWPDDDVSKYGFQVIGFKPVFQEKVKMFMEENDLDSGFGPRHRLMDLVSEVGEISKEILKADSYGRENEDFDRVRPSLEEEIGDAFYSLIALANSVGIDMMKALETAMNKYKKRIDSSGNAGSRDIT